MEDSQNGSVDVDVGVGADADALGDETIRASSPVQEQVRPEDFKSAAQRAYLAHTAPHVLDSLDSSGPSAASSRSPSPSRAGASLAAQNKRALASTKHVVPPNFRGPIPRDSDAEEVAPLPPLHPVVASSSGSSALPLFQTHNTPLNRNSWRYTFAGPWTQELPYSVYRSIPVEPRGVHWDWSDRSAFTQMSSDARVVSSDRGWRSARANLPVRQGSWYCEVEILPSATNSTMKDGSHVRLGWGRREAPLNAPVGFDGYSYGLRDTSGQRVFLSRPSDYGQPFKPDDVVGMYITIPELSKPNPRDPRDPRHVRRKRIPIRYRDQLYFEQLEYAHSKEMEHLVERSWKGEQLTRTDGTIGCLRDAGGRGLDVQSTALSVEAEAEHVRKSSRKAKHQYDVAPSNPTAPPSRQHEETPSSLHTPSAPPSFQSKQKGVTNKRKHHANANANDDGDKKKTGGAGSTLRPVPTLGPESAIGFVLNGKPLGWAFRDLLDFRPLRSADPPRGSKNASGADAHSAPAKKSKKAKRVDDDGDENGVKGLDPSSGGAASLAALDPDEISALTTSASLSAIMKSRENIHDDGSTGYFPFVSMYGGARVKLRTEVSEFTALPSGVDVSAEEDQAVIRGLHEALDAVHGPTSPSPSPPPPTLPLASLATHYWAAQHLIDINEEERAKMRTQYLVAKYGQNYGKDESDEDDGDGGTPEAAKSLAAASSSSKRKNKASSASASASASLPHSRSVSVSLSRQGTETPGAVANVSDGGGLVKVEGEEERVGGVDGDGSGQTHDVDVKMEIDEAGVNADTPRDVDSADEEQRPPSTHAQMPWHDIVGVSRHGKGPEAYQSSSSGISTPGPNEVMAQSAESPAASLATPPVVDAGGDADADADAGTDDDA